MPPASYLTKSALAAELMISESTVDDYVRRGLLPPPIRISPSCVRWRWATLDAILRASESPRWSVEDSSPEERAAREIEASRQPTLQDRAAAEGVARILAAARERRNKGQVIDPGAAQAIAASKERSRPVKKPKGEKS
ncbi:putative DNA-binding transcriptional regulator AlpA [Methylobacterium sp. OAE515]